MGTIAEKLSYLDTTREKIKESINITGVGITEQDTFRSYEHKLKLGLVDTINNGTDTLYENFPKVTGEGSSITLNDTYNCKMKSEIEGDTYQFSTTGKNLFDKTQITNDYRLSTSGSLVSDSDYFISDYIEIETNTNYIFNYVRTQNYDRVCYYDDNKNFVTLNSSATQEITTPTGVKYLRFGFEKDKKDTLMLESGSTATTYEPYTGGQPSPSPDYPQDIEVVTGLQEVDIVGKNLFSSEMEVGAINNTTGENEANNNCIRSIDYIPVKPNTTYTLSNLLNYNALVHEYAEDKTYIQYDGNYNTPRTFTTTANTYYIRVRSAAGQTQNNLAGKYMLNFGNAPLPYKAFESQNYQINLGKNLANVTLTHDYISSVGIITAAGNNKYLGVSNNIPVKPNTQYTISFTNYTVGSFLYGAFNQSGTFIERVNIGTTDRTFTTGNDVCFIRPYFYNSSEIYDDLTGGFQLELGSQATPYSPYFTPIELCKIGNYKDYIKKSTGKNLFDKDNANIINGFFTLDNSTLRENIDTRTIYIPCNANTTYTISKLVGARFYVSYAKQIPEIGITLYNRIGANNDNTPLTITTDSDAKYLVAFIYNSSVDTTYTLQQILDTIQIEEGNSPSEYEPYGTNWYIKKEIGKVVVDGSEDWNNDTGTVGKNYRHYINKTALNITSVSNYNIFSNYFINGVTGDVFGYANLGGNYLLFFDKDKVYTLEGFKTWLSTHNTEVYYVLATPTYETITQTNYPELYGQLNDLENAMSYNEQTNINVDGDLPALLDIIALGDS